MFPLPGFLLSHSSSPSPAHPKVWGEKESGTHCQLGARHSVGVFISINNNDKPK